ncbi:LemA family protein [Candidatus Woesearchaeota archaeon]|nr:LemA family protein [Candidatus Woesearchaeota archaeon]
MVWGIIAVVGVAILLVAIAFLGYFFTVYNALVQLKNNIQKAWSNIDVLLKQRADELPKLINSVKGYMKHEKGTLEDLTKARTAFLNAKTMGEKAAADNMMSSTLKTLFAVSENYPTLKANENFIQLQTRISGIENELADRREFYNDSVNTYNIRIASIPDAVIANMLHYQREELFKATDAERKDVEVSF